MPEEVTLFRIEGLSRRRCLTSTQAFQNMNAYFAWEYQKDEPEAVIVEGVTTMLYMNRRAKIKLLKKMAPDYQVEHLNFGNYTAQEISEIWQDDDLLDQILCELIEALPNQ